MRKYLIALTVLLLTIFGVPAIQEKYIALSAETSESDNTTSDEESNENTNENEEGEENEEEKTELEKKLDELFAAVPEDEYFCNNPSDDVLFPHDTRLENCVRKYSHAVRWPMPCYMAAEITAIECDDPEITSLQGLQQFPNLKTLSFSLKGTKIDDLSPIRNLEKMDTLKIPYSEVSEIGYLAHMANLRVLDLKGNHVTNLEFIPFLPNLEILSLEYQAPDYVSDITPLETLTRMHTLNLQGNKITDISPLSDMKTLTHLVIRDNRISDLTPLSEVIDLDVIDFSINQISDISPLEKMTNLKMILGSNNKISDISILESMTQITELRLINNQISDISSVAPMIKAKALIFDYNDITDISPVTDLVIRANLQELGLSYNCVLKEDYRKIPYIDTIKVFRVDHQCEDFPDGIYPDNQLVVNGDIVNGHDTLKDNGIVVNRFAASSGGGGGGCSALPYEALSRIDIALLIIICAIALHIMRISKKNKQK